MPVTVHLVRHAQGEHNLSHDAELLPDPSLTALGLTQCAALHASFPHHADLTHLVASPMRRTIQTCLASFAPSSSDSDSDPDSGSGSVSGSASVSATPGLPVILLPKLQEIGPWPCDTGSPTALLETEFGAQIDTRRVHAEPEWTRKREEGNLHQAVFAQIEKRALAARQELQQIARDYRAREGGDTDVHMAVVSHGAFLHFLSGCFYEIPRRTATVWSNAAYRTFTFADPTLQDENAELVETQESWNAVHGADKQRPTTAEEKKELQEAYKKLVGVYLSDEWQQRK
ncbi:hypothetical protein TD95_000020 [Thielaviopsis punctulata]|uniref:Uncharacterized protein n=1 Tax=Thielaviopsis punctulata TaxID=72032 RepID=A0A0F4Z8V1_9PEZI|nr:hypothetical protein TD95_000020 [Thielaviopsis punctulata]